MMMKNNSLKNMESRAARDQAEFNAYRNKWGLSKYLFLIPCGSKDILYVCQIKKPDMRQIKKQTRHVFSVIQYVHTLVRVAKEVRKVYLCTKELHNHQSQFGSYTNHYQYFDSWNAFLEYCMILKLSGIEDN